MKEDVQSNKFFIDKKIKMNKMRKKKKKDTKNEDDNN
jgi:hypothetical protein